MILGECHFFEKNVINYKINQMLYLKPYLKLKHFGKTLCYINSSGESNIDPNTMKSYKK